jgi:2-dehydropantoate 2-reductase
MQMRVAIVGAGGIGCVFGGRLAAAGHQVWLVHRRRDVVDALRRDGLRLDSADGTHTVHVAATDDPREIGLVDLVLIVTKSPDTRAAADSARPLLHPATAVVTLQNGLGNVETIGEALGPERVLLGMTYVGAAVVAPGHVRLTAPGQTFVGEPGGASQRVPTPQRMPKPQRVPTPQRMPKPQRVPTPQRVPMPIHGPAAWRARSRTPGYPRRPPTASGRWCGASSSSTPR